MANYIIKITENKYVEWSTVCDAPNMSIMTEEECKEYVWELERNKVRLDRISDQKQLNLQKELIEVSAKNRWDRIQKTGTSALDGTNVKDIADYNRAGKNESKLSLDEIITTYTYDDSKKGQWPWV